MLNEYHTFADVDDRELRAWNRCAVAFNILADENRDLMNEYLAQFSEEDKWDIHNMYERIKNDGYQQTRAAVSRNYNAIRPVYEAEDV